MRARHWDCLGLLARLALGALFLYSGLAKVARQEEFYHTLIGYEIISGWGAVALARVLPWAEAVLGLLLVLGVRTRAAAVTAASLLVVFLGVLLSALARGITLGDCGCFPGSGPPGPVSVARDLLFLLAAVYVAARPRCSLAAVGCGPLLQRLRPGWQALPLSRKIALLVTANVAFALALVGLFASWALADTLEKTVGRHMLDLARTAAAEPEVRRAYASPQPSALLQPFSERFRARTGADLVVFLSMDRIRYSHFDPAHVGKVYTAGDEGPALHGASYVSRAYCVGGPSVRGLAPVYGEDGRQVGVVVVGMFLDTMAAGARGARLAVAAAFLLALLVGTGGAVALARNIKAALRGLEPREIGALLQQREAMLASLREGVVAVDREGRITLLNDTARRLLGVGDEALGRPVAEVIPSTRLHEVVATGQPQYDQEQALGDRLIITNRVPIVLDGQVAGAVATFRDRTEVTRLAEELTGVRRFAEALRAQNHEFHNRLQVVAGLIELGAADEALRYIASATRERQEQVRAILERVREPLVSALLLGKLSEAEEAGIALVLDPDSRLDPLPCHFDGHAAVLVLGNLLQNACEAVARVPDPGERWVTVGFRDGPRAIRLTVGNGGAPIPPESLPHLFEKGWSTKGSDRGLGLYLVQQQVERAGGRIQVRSAPGTGTRFEVWIPRRAAGLAPAATVAGGEVS